MENVMNYGFVELSNNEMTDVDGGFFLTATIALIAIGNTTIAVTPLMIGGAIAGAYGAGKTAYEIYNAFK